MDIIVSTIFFQDFKALDRYIVKLHRKSFKNQILNDFRYNLKMVIEYVH